MIPILVAAHRTAQEPHRRRRGGARSSGWPRCWRLAFIRRARELGFTLDAVRGFRK
jgi:DNA-binding transcriptional MerR regulator